MLLRYWSIIAVLLFALPVFAVEQAEQIGEKHLGKMTFIEDLRRSWQDGYYEQFRVRVGAANAQAPDWVPAVLAQSFVLSAIDGRPVEAVKLLRNLKDRLPALEEDMFNASLLMRIETMEQTIAVGRKYGHDEATWAAAANPDAVRSVGAEQPFFDLLEISPDTILVAQETTNTAALVQITTDTTSKGTKAVSLSPASGEREATGNVPKESSKLVSMISIMIIAVIFGIALILFRGKRQ